MKLDEIKELMQLFEASELNKLQIKHKDFEIEMQKNSKQTISPSVLTPIKTAPLAKITSVTTESRPVKPKKAITREVISSPVVGTFYASPSPDSSPFVKIGDRVNTGNVLCILEAMNTMNELKAESDCKILDILVENGDPVEYDKPLFVVEKI